MMMWATMKNIFYLFKILNLNLLIEVIVVSFSARGCRQHQTFKSDVSVSFEQLEISSEKGLCQSDAAKITKKNLDIYF